jgi:hypothetical protein
MAKTLGGFTMIRNGDHLDYCYREAIKSMLAVCDQVVVSDCESDDGTRNVLDVWATIEPKLKIVDYKWTDPRADPSWYPKWINETRKHLDTDWATYMDADEVWHQNAYPHIRQFMAEDKVMMAYRYNFWRDAKSLIPVGECCGVHVIRLGPAALAFPSDYPTPESGEISSRAVWTTVPVMHYGFLRRREAFFKKARAVQRIWADSYDPRLELAETYEGNWMEDKRCSEWVDKLDTYKEKHPTVIIPWLRARGYPVSDDGTPL